MKVCWFSTGISSFVACYLAKDVDEIIYTHVSNQNPDSLRFLHDCEKLLCRKIMIIQSDRFDSVDDVMEFTHNEYSVRLPMYEIFEERSKKKMGIRASRSPHLCMGVRCE